MGKLKVVAESPDPELTLSLDFQRTEAVFVAGEVLSGSIACHAAHPFECEGIVVTMTARERVDGIEGRPFHWEHVLLEQKIDLNCGSSQAFSAGTHSIPFTINLEPTLAASYTFESVSIGSKTQIKLTRLYVISATFSLRNSTKVETAAEIVVKRNTDVVWPGSLPSASLEDTIVQLVGSPLSNCLCWRRGDTAVSATLHNRTVDIACGVVHVRVFVVNRSGLSVTAARLCLLVDTALHPERATGTEEEDEENAPSHMIELLSATDYHRTQVAPGSSAHFNLELDVKRVALSLLFDQETVLEPSIRTRFLEIGYIVRVEVCHANGGSTLSLDLPLVLVPLESDILPPLETQPLSPIRGSDSQASTAHEDEESDTKSQQNVSSRVSSMEIRAPQTTEPTFISINPLQEEESNDKGQLHVTSRASSTELGALQTTGTSISPINSPVDEDIPQHADPPPAPPANKVYERDIQINTRGGM